MIDHSPHPWQWTPKSGIDGQTVLWAGYDMIVLVSIAKPVPADARLIAAAPDLLAALEELEKWTEAFSVSSGVTIEEEAKHFNPEFYAAMLQARAAIAKARGKDEGTA